MTRKEFLIETITEAGSAIKRAIPSVGLIEKEGRGNIVTAADLAAEKIIIDAIKSSYPNDQILSEESDTIISDPLSVDQLWVIDPIDGTNNFRFDRNYSAISIGYIEKGMMKQGAVYDPFRDELFYAEEGVGAYLNNRKIVVSKQLELGKASVATDNSYDPKGTRRNLEIALSLPKTPWMIIKGGGVLTMCEVAAGRVDLYYHTFLKPWDNAAAFLIAKEAGAKVIGIDGSEINFLSTHVVMGNATIVDEFLQSRNE